MKPDSIHHPNSAVFSSWLPESSLLRALQPHVKSPQLDRCSDKGPQHRVCHCFVLSWHQPLLLHPPPGPCPDPAAHLWLTMRLSSHFGSAVALSWELSTCPEGYKQGGSSATNIKIEKKSYLSFSVIFGPPGFLLKASWKPSGSVHLKGSSAASPEIDGQGASVLGASVPRQVVYPHSLCPNPRQGAAERGGSPGLCGHQ